MVKKVVFLECSICNEIRDSSLKELHKGLILKGKFICWSCNEKITESLVSDEEYDFYKNKIKEIL